MTIITTIGADVAAILAAAAEPVTRTVVGEIVKDCYKALKEKLAPWAALVGLVEQTPASPHLQGALAEEIDKLPDGDKAEIKRLSLALNEALRTAAKSNPTGIDIGKLEAANVRLQAINVTSGTGFRAKEVITPGDFIAKDSTVGKTPR